MSNPKVEEIFHAALERRGAERAAYLERACAGDAALRAEVETLIAFHERGGGLLGSASSAREPEVERLGRYPVLGTLGRGSMGVVYLAEDPVLKRRIAIKVLSDVISRDVVRLARFENEARALAALNHPNIATIYTLELAGDARVITMELVSGRTLADRLCDGPLAIDEALPLCRQIASALEAAHDKSIVDRDLKPANVMVTAEGVVKVLDFGIAKIAPTARLRGGGAPAEDVPGGGSPAGGSPAGGAASHDEQPLTEPGFVIGTPGYMSPEQLRGDDVDHRTDIWAFGCIFFECLTGRHPFGRASHVDTLAAILERSPDWTRLPAGTPEAIRRLIERCLDRSPDGRPQSMRSVRQTIEQELMRRAVPCVVTVPPAATASAVRNNLPLEVDPFIGRTGELAAVRRLLGEHRLVTLTGAGGCGKTRLALEIAREALDAFPDGVMQVDLASVVRPQLVPETVAAVFGVSEEPRRALTESLIDHLGKRRLLIVLDNVEGVLQAVAELAARLLREQPGIRLLVTSREALAIPGEAIYRVRPLAIPVNGDLRTARELRAAESVQLFVERARAANVMFELVDANASAIGKICRHLDGIPLALELAAARVKVLPVEEIARRLDDRFHLLTGGSKTARPHHQTLRALIDWSYQQLTGAERQVFERLSVFGGGWTLPAAEEVVAGDGIESWEVLDLCCQLVEKCLAELDTEATRATGEPRYTMLESIRAYARDRLRERAGDAACVRARYVAVCLRLAEEATPHLRGPDAANWFGRLDLEYGNLRAALDACVAEDVGETDAAGASGRVVEGSVADGPRIDVGLGLRLAEALGPYWLVRGRWEEGRRVCDALLRHPAAPERDGARADVLSWAGGLARRQGQDDEARRYYEESLAISRRLGDPRLVARALSNLALVLQHQGEMERAGRLLEESLAVAEELGDQQQIAACVSNLGSHAYRRHDHAVATARFTASLDIHRRLGQQRGIAAALNNLGNVALAHGELDQARLRFEESHTISRELGDRYLIAIALGNLARVSERGGDRERAGTLHREALAIHRRLGRRREVAMTLVGLAGLAIEGGDLDAAGSLLDESLVLSREIGLWRGVSESLAHLALVAERRGDTWRAVRLLAAARVIGETADMPLGVESEARWQRMEGRLRGAVDASCFERLWTEGRALSPSRAIDLARSDQSDQSDQSGQSTGVD